MMALKVTSNLQCYLGKHFEMKDLRPRSFLGFKVSSRSYVHYLSQAKHASNLSTQSSIIDSATSSIHVGQNVHLSPFNGVPLDDVTLYRQLVGNLIYLTITRAYIAYIVLVVNQIVVAPPRTIHMLLLYFSFFIISRVLLVMDFSFLLSHLWCYF